MWNQARAIVWAQFRTVLNYIPRSNKFGLIFSGLLMATWYAGFGLIAVMVAVFASNPDELHFVHSVLPTVLLLCVLYWQLVPVLMASTGSALDIKKLLVYPIPHRQLFALEVLLRVSTGVEVLLLTSGAAVGLLFNPKVPLWAPFTLVFFIAFNLFCSAGVRDFLVRMLARKRVREITTLLFVLVMALPQMVVFGGFRNRLGHFFSSEASPYWLWTASARLAQGEFSWISAAVVLSWTLAAFFFGRWQFERGLTFDFGAAAADTAPRGRTASRLDWLYGLPNAILRDPLAALVEKELRFLSRAPRFRLVFLMGFSFGILIWFPMAFGARGGVHLIADNYLTFVSVYALLLLSDSLFWNAFGFDRSAAQTYFLVPLPISTVLLGKNLAAVLFVLIEILAVTLVCVLLRLPVTPQRMLEALSVTVVITTFLLSIGNLSSIYNPRAMNPMKSFRNTAGSRMQAMLMLLFPVTLMPVALAYLARYAFESEWAFFGVLLVGAAFGGLIYWFSMGSAVKAAANRTEQIIATLSQGDGVVQS